ncbi:Copper resistance protein D [compost metagenome]
MQSYFWVKTFHLVFVVAWMASVFYLPRILVNIAEASGQPAVVERLQLMGKRLYGFGHSMFGIAFLLGLVLWLGYKVLPDFPTMVAPGAAGWLHAKLGLVVLLLVYFIFTGRWLKGTLKGKALPSSRALRWFNELPLVLFIGVVWLVLAKPF